MASTFIIEEAVSIQQDPHFLTLLVVCRKRSRGSGAGTAVGVTNATQSTARCRLHPTDGATFNGHSVRDSIARMEGTDVGGPSRRGRAFLERK